MVKSYTLEIDNINTDFISEALPCEVRSLLTFPNLHDNIKSFPEDFSIMYVQSNISKLLLQLLSLYGLESSYEKFITFICASQYTFKLFSDHEDITESELYKHLIKSRAEYERLLTILKSHLEGNSKVDYQQISFKMKNEKKQDFNNFWVVNDIYDRLCTSYGLTVENYTKRAEEIISSNSELKLDKGSEYIKVNIVLSLYSFLPKNIKKADKLRFIGLTLHLAGIPTNNLYEPLLYVDFHENLRGIDIKNLAHYLEYRGKLFT